MGTAIGMHRDKRAIIVGMLRHSSTALTTPQIVARAGLGRVTVARELAALEAEGVIGRIVGKPQRWYWRGGAGEAAAS
ncbi:MAG TPA: hypothetical protein VIL85_07360 [Thermomicrobiales bacterium]|jgi:Fic family protein